MDFAAASRRRPFCASFIRHPRALPNQGRPAALAHPKTGSAISVTVLIPTSRGSASVEHKSVCRKPPALLTAVQAPPIGEELLARLGPSHGPLLETAQGERIARNA